MDPLGPYQADKVMNLHLLAPKPSAFAASISSWIMALSSVPPASCSHVAAGYTLPVYSFLVSRDILAIDIVVIVRIVEFVKHLYLFTS